ncbi:hypothetical protein B0H11DRAFT_2415869 [Mycena galericulata]|nr:hypothetical protein B0H11DRAFT_2415869 [Mycena galericulata]
MAPGANYMGGKRNAARTRSKDTTGRVQKTFFSRQRLDILSKNLSGRAHSRENSSGYGPRVTASDIALSHAKHVENENNSPADAFIPHPHPKSAVKRHSKPSDPGSRVLEALDTKEPLAMRAAMDKILSIPDLAGLSTRRMKRARTPDSEPQYPEPKRQKSSSLSPLNQDIEKIEFESMAVDADESENEYSEAENDPIFQQPASSNAAKKENSPTMRQLPQPRHLNHPAVALSAHSAYKTPQTPPSEQDDNAAAGFRLRDNLYEYEDPWNAIGVILGLEKEDHQNASVAEASDHPYSAFNALASVQSHSRGPSSPTSNCTPPAPHSHISDASNSSSAGNPSLDEPAMGGPHPHDTLELSNPSNELDITLTALLPDINHSQGSCCAYSSSNHRTSHSPLKRPLSPASPTHSVSHTSNVDNTISNRLHSDQSLIDANEDLQRMPAAQIPAVDDSLRHKFSENSFNDFNLNTDHSRGSSFNLRARRGADDTLLHSTPPSDAYSLTDSHIVTKPIPHLQRDDETPAVDGSLRLKFPTNSLHESNLYTDHPRTHRGADALHLTPTSPSDAHSIPHLAESRIVKNPSPHLQRDGTPLAVGDSLRIKFPTNLTNKSNPMPSTLPSDSKIAPRSLFNLQKGSDMPWPVSAAHHDSGPQTPPRVAVRPPGPKVPWPTYTHAHAPPRHYPSTSPEERLPRFAKFSSPLPLKCPTPAYVGVPSPRERSTPPRSPHFAETFSHGPSASHTRVELESCGETRPVEGSRFRNHREIECPGDEGVADVQLEELVAGDPVASVGDEGVAGLENAGRSISQPAQFFGEICLFSDDVDEPDSDD